LWGGVAAATVFRHSPASAHIATSITQGQEIGAMGFSSIWHWLIVLVIVLLLFGAGKLPKVMGDLAKGIKNFKAGLKDESDDAAAQVPAAAPVIPAQPAAQPTAQPAAAPVQTAAAPQQPDAGRP
jgi:sec-independent protein translocase protein TatA